MSFTSLSNYHANAAKKQTSGEKPSAGSSPSRKVGPCMSNSKPS